MPQSPQDVHEDASVYARLVQDKAPSNQAARTDRCSGRKHTLGNSSSSSTTAFNRSAPDRHPVAFEIRSTASTAADVRTPSESATVQDSPTGLGQPGAKPTGWPT